MLDAVDKKIIAGVQEEFPLVAEPYKELAEKIGIGEDELISRLRKCHEQGIIRKFGAVLRHREVGYAANALCAWIVPEKRLKVVGRMMAASQAVTHCYARVSRPDWPYNFYTMLHGHNREECGQLAVQLAQETGLSEYVLLFSTREWKKTSMRYFREDVELSD